MGELTAKKNHLLSGWDIQYLVSFWPEPEPSFKKWPDIQPSRIGIGYLAHP